MSRFGKRNGPPDPKFGMRGRNDGAIRRARLGAKMRGHKLKPGLVAPATKQHREMFYAWCKCGAAVVVEDGYQPRGSALERSCDGVDRSIDAKETHPATNEEPQLMKDDARVGRRVRLLHCADLYSPNRAGLEGTVAMIDDTGTIHVRWDNGSTLGLVPGVDRWEDVR